MRLTKLSVAALGVFLCQSALASQPVVVQQPSPYVDINIIPGPYIGIDGGYGMTDYGTGIKNSFHHNFNTTMVDEDGLAGRAYIGYQLSPQWGMEAGYMQFSTNDYKGTNPNVNFDRYHVKTDGVDVLAVWNAPCTYAGWGANIKAGGAYIMSRASLSGAPIVGLRTGNSDKFAPEAGASLTYKVDQNVFMDVSYLHVFGSGNINSPRTDFVGAGLSYHFA